MNRANEVRRAPRSAMAIRITCANPQCRKTLHARDELAGNRVKCPGCGQVAVLPAASTPAGTPLPAPPRPIPPQPPKAALPEEGVGKSPRRLWPWAIAGGGVAALAVVV